MSGRLMRSTGTVGGIGRRPTLRQPGMTVTRQAFGSITGGSSYRLGYFVA
jgi:hypothetical protein